MSESAVFTSVCNEAAGEIIISNLTNDYIVCVFAFPSISCNPANDLKLKEFIFPLEKKSKSTLQIVYTNIYTHRNLILTELPLNEVHLHRHIYTHTPLKPRKS